MMFGKTMGRVAIAAVAMCAMAPANATSFVFTTATNSALFGGVNSLPFSSGGISVSATAWSTSDLANTTLPVQGYVGQYTGGLGVTNAGEGNGNTNNSHTIDNVVQYDFIRLVFSTAVNLNGITLNGFPVDGSSGSGANIDTDAWVSYGTGTGAFNSSALWQGYISRGVDVSNGAFSPSGNFSTVWLIGAARSSTDRDDGFKLAGVTATAQNIVPQVPEPATWLMLTLGFGLTGAALRRRTKPALVATAA